MANGCWRVELANGVVADAERVVLATGAHPRSLNYDCSHEISLDTALNKTELAGHVTEHDTVAVVGSAHSAVLVMKFLSELSTGRIINLYTKPLVYPQAMDGWVLHGDSGLKGVAAQWAKNVLEKNLPCKLVRLHNTEDARKAWLPICTKIIYAAGFERNPIPACQPIMSYDTSTGKIASGLFGIGIAFPEVAVDPLGNEEHKIGLGSFMQHALEQLPEWMHSKSALCRFNKFEELFTVCVL